MKKLKYLDRYENKATWYAATQKIKKANKGKLLQGEDLTIILETIKFHDNYQKKVGCGIKDIGVFKTPKGFQVNDSDFCFWVIRTDGSREEISNKSCIQHPSKKTNQSAAFRGVVEPYNRYLKIALMKEVSINGKIPCSICNELFNSNEIELHHETAFKDKVEAFKSSHGYTNADLIRVDNETRQGFQYDDVENDWYEFHKDCPVTLICKQCHLEETRKQRTSAPHQPEYLGQCPDCFDVVYEGDCHECAE